MENHCAPAREGVLSLCLDRRELGVIFDEDYRWKTEIYRSIHTTMMGTDFPLSIVRLLGVRLLRGAGTSTNNARVAKCTLVSISKVRCK